MTHMLVCARDTKFILDYDTIIIDCPNKFGGIGYMSGTLVKSLWTGCTHIYFEEKVKLMIQFCDITSLDITEDFGSDDSPWAKIWEREKDYHFTYAYWDKLAEKIRSIKKSPFA